MENAFFIAALEGEWSFHRTVTLGMSMRGAATFERRSSHHLSYLEQGLIVETRIEFTRAYDYVIDGANLSVFYADGPDKGSRFLYFEGLISKGFPFSGKANHLCGKDHYAADFTFSSESEFYTHYDVMGPTKLHGITTGYTKL